MGIETMAKGAKMKVLASFLFVIDAANYIEEHNLDAIVDKNIFTGKYDVLECK
tara:strand:+ start:174 stop:332 length:159 start_codon:yes stop_codon:yes gene_type:complete